MRVFICGIVCSLFVIGLLVAPVGAEKVLPVVTVDFPPYAYMDNDKPSGAFVEVFGLISKELGLTPDFHFYPTKRAQAEAADGVFAAIFALTKSAKRLEAYYYMDPVCQIYDVFFKSSDRVITWDTLDDLSEYTIGYTDGYNYAPVFLDTIKSGKLKTDSVTGRNPERRHIAKLLSDRIDMFICEAGVCQFIINENPNFSKIDYINKPIGPVRTFHIVFSKKYPEAEKLRDQFNEEFAKLVKQGVIQEILRKHNIAYGFLNE